MHGTAYGSITVFARDPFFSNAAATAQREKLSEHALAAPDIASDCMPFPAAGW